MLGNVVTIKVFSPAGGVIREALLSSEPDDVLMIECVGDKACACRGVSAFTARSMEETGEVNQSIKVGEIRVQPGDLAIGDDDGVFILAAQRAYELLAGMLAKEQMDQARRDELMQKHKARRLC